MSAFLGPIHYWLYNKIKLQQDIVDKLYLLGESYAEALREYCEETFGTFENKPLEEMIDQGNIHGWLQERVSQVEYKYAYCITTLLASHPESLTEIQSIVSANGKTFAQSMKDTLQNPSDVYKAISDLLLDGMPCDHANRLVANNENEVIWSRATCVHSTYWDEVNGDISIYYALRDYWIEGFVSELEATDQLRFAFDRPDEVSYRIRVINKYHEREEVHS